MDIEPKVRHPDCPDVHLGVCAKCRRLYEREERVLGSNPQRQAGVEVGSLQVSPAPEGMPVNYQNARAGEIPASLTPAEKQRAYRERLKADPERYAAYLERERLRKRVNRDPGG